MTRIKLIQSLSGHQDRAWSLDWSPSEPLLASCSSDKSIRLYSFQPPSSESSTSDQFHLSSTIPTSHTRTVRNLSFSPTGTTLATASFDSTVGIWCRINEAGLDDPSTTDADAAQGDQGEWEAVDPLEGHESECKSVSWSGDGRLLASCSRDKSVWVWEAVGPAEFECLAVLMEHTQDVKCVTWHPHEELLASSSYDDQIHLYAPDPYDDEWILVHKLSPSHSGTVWSVSFSPCGQYLASTGDDLTLKIWKRIELKTEVGTAGEAKREEGGSMGPWSRSGVRIGQKERFEWKEVVRLEGIHERSVYSLDWKKGGIEEKQGGLGRIATCAGDGKIRIWQVTRPTSTEPEAAPILTSLITLEDAHGLSDINSIKWCTLSPSKAAATLRSLEGGEEDDEMANDSSTDVDSRWKGCEDWFATAGDDGLIKIWKLEQEEGETAVDDKMQE
ncbi:hypothetical protein JCM3765_001089 [Sporobolomyces pararoseus]